MEDNTSAKFEFLASFILPNGILDWFDFVKANEEPVEKKDCIYKSTLHIYLDENGKNVILNLYPTTAEGTRYSEDFAVFLKGADGLDASYRPIVRALFHD